MKKEAIWSKPGIDDAVSGQQGETEVNVHWPKFREWFMTEGQSLPENLIVRTEPSAVKIVYTYIYNYDLDMAEDINGVQVDDYASDTTLKDPNLISGFIEYYKDQIEQDIKIGEQDIKLEMNPPDPRQDHNYDDQIDRDLADNIPF